MPFLPVPQPNPDPIACQSREHEPPNMMVYPPGSYAWQCPSCGHITVFFVRQYHLLQNSQEVEGGCLGDW